MIGELQTSKAGVARSSKSYLFYAQEEASMQNFCILRDWSYIAYKRWSADKHFCQQ